MTKEQFAAILNGREYGKELHPTERDFAKECGLVVVYGYSDDNMEFVGAIDDEVGCWKGGIFYLDEAGLWGNECENEACPYAKKEQGKCKTIRAVWHEKKGEPCWTYETEIPHAKFNIYENGDLFCVGIVFEMVALAERKES